MVIETEYGYQKVKNRFICPLRPLVGRCMKLPLPTLMYQHLFGGSVSLPVNQTSDLLTKAIVERNVVVCK